LKILTVIDRLTVDNDTFEISPQPHRRKAVWLEEYCRCFSSIQFSKNRLAPRGRFSNLPQRAVTVNFARQNRNEL